MPDLIEYPVFAPQGQASHLRSAAPTAAAGANAGGSPPAPVVTAGSNDARGALTFGTGTTPAAGAQAVVTFANPYLPLGAQEPLASPVVMLNSLNTATQALGLYVSSLTPTGFTVSCTTAPAASQGNTVYSVQYVVQD